MYRNKISLVIFVLCITLATTFVRIPIIPSNVFSKALFYKNYNVANTKTRENSNKFITYAIPVRVQSNGKSGETLYDKTNFLEFYRKTVSSGNEMIKEDFLKYDIVSNLLQEGLIYMDDIDDLWISVVGDSIGLNEEEAFEMVCMVSDLPDPENIAFYDSEFNKMADGKTMISFFNILNWQDVKDMINEEALTMEEVSDIWRTIAGDLNAKISRQQFSKFNRYLDDLIEEKDETDELEEVDTTNIIEEKVTSNDIPNTIDVWDQTGFNPTSVFDADVLKEITDYFIKSTGSLKNEFSYQNLQDWSDIKEMLQDGSLLTSDIQKAWKEATSNGRSTINYDRFLRLNVRLDLLMDESEVENPATNIVDDDADRDDAESFYRTEFYKVTGGGPLMRLDMLLEWKEVSDLVKEGAITEKQIQKLFDGMPREPMGIPSTSLGITESTFITFNSMLDVLLDVSDSTTNTSETKKPAQTPLSLVSEPPRPLPKKDFELKIGSMVDSSQSSDNEKTTGLSVKELEMMELLDKADNMLNSGSFGDFDRLIGDINDPRLQALRQKRDGATEVDGKLQDLVVELLQLGNQQSRCGLDKPTEENAARIRDLIQAVIEKNPALAETKDILDIRTSIIGKWKLLYSNSEMFDFYNGVTGFANVFPSSKFQDLTVEFNSDGYLNEAKYIEKLSTPLGSVDATVYANFDLLKEMSFMTNTNSVVLRNYCTKVTAGPMEYEAQENWKSLRTLSMNEVVYVDDKIKITRNCGALRIYFLFARI